MRNRNNKYFSPSSFEQILNNGEIEELKEDEKIKSLIDSEIIKLDQKDVKYYVLEKADIESMGLNNINMDDGYYIVEYMSNEIIYSAGIENEEGNIVYLSLIHI